MTTSLLLRISSIISFLFAAGHTLGGRKSWSPIGETDVLKAMRTFRFDVAGVNRSYLEFYQGFGFILSVCLVLQAVLLWQLGALAKTNRAQTIPFVRTFFVASIASAILTWKFLFPVPVYFSLVVTACLGLALVV